VGFSFLGEVAKRDDEEVGGGTGEGVGVGVDARGLNASPLFHCCEDMDRVVLRRDEEDERTTLESIWQDNLLYVTCLPSPGRMVSTPIHPYLLL
jgi:hypothetical protein